MNSNSQMMAQTQAHEQYLTQRYNQALLQLKTALNLSHFTGEIPPHVLVAKAVALLKFQFHELQKIQSKYPNHSPWDHPKYNNSRFRDTHSTNSHNFKQTSTQKKNSTIYYHDTRHFYKSRSGDVKEQFDPSKFCPSIQQETNDSNLVPPLQFEDDTDCDTMEIDNTLQNQTASKLGIKYEPNTSSNAMDTGATNEFSSEWETSAFSMLEDDIEFDIPLDFHSSFI